MRFGDQVVLVTGASRGLGRAFAEGIAAAGGVVAVNSTGRDDTGEQTVAAIRAAGGRAFDVPGRVEEAAALVEATLEQGGRLDAVVHNAGFLHDRSLRKMSSDEWDAVLDVHLGAAFRLTQAAWPSFVAAGAGRLVFMTSAAGLYGNFGQANYAAAKMGMYGLCRTIALEGKKTNITCNCIAPFGATEMNSGSMPDAMKAVIRPEYVAPLVGYLAHPDCQESGGLFEASAGTFTKVRWERSRGLRLDTSQPLSIADVANGWDQVVDFSSSDHPRNMGEALQGLTQPPQGARASS
jgi:NAD(P)-dependent dehydrogenase (short-subunit alcohol dehydrogenase family)